jgi:hypothetical protein
VLKRIVFLESLHVGVCKQSLLILLFPGLFVSSSAQTIDGPPLPPVGRVRLAAVHAKTDLKSGTGRGRVSTKLHGKQVEVLAFQSTFSADKYAVTVHYPQPQKGHELIWMQTMITDGTLTFGTRVSERARPQGNVTEVWRDGKPLGGRPSGLSIADIFPYDVTNLCQRAIHVPLVMDKYDVKLVAADDTQVQMAYTIGKKTEVAFTAEAHSGFNVTQLSASVDGQVRQSYQIGWERSEGVWYVRRMQEKWLRQDKIKTDEQERTLEYDDFQPNVEIDETMFDLSRVEEGWFNDRLMYPHGKP